ncbi:Ppx/GppA family phosphatase [Sphingosinicella rhizophila]|uniref:Ppx/GppA family phosphatase n=1 Tax=Sphingosinicella rhizophila TaxID=3050082 RepID=A0ABU3Q2T6_9SPHN|nr:Ppx/GppA family phosphatase [Sphingosinicella sp. GR2756]MDT9597716.1 Ppx/GppA family phosphatase [Sphingosinicella sp. GR2756]
MLDREPVAIVDIGSNSVRLVVYAGAPRIPSIIFNEKVMAGLGEGIAETGALSVQSQEKALSALRRFWLLIGQMGVARTRVVATAAVRDASNGADFLGQVRAIGFKPQILSGEREGKMAGLGVISGAPDADGIAGDLGGGSLELVDIKNGAVRKSISLPIGVLRPLPSESDLRMLFRQALKETGMASRGKGRPFYLVGGSWRTIGRLDMIATDYPLPITHHYRMEPARTAAIAKFLGALHKADPKSLATVTATRIPTLPVARQILDALVRELRPSELIVSSFGIREGLLYSELDARIRKLDPLLEAAREAGRGLSRFGEHGDLLDRWIRPIFDDDQRHARIRLAACLLADVAWQAHPDFRAERGLEMALHGNWVGVDASERVMMAQALFSNFGGGRRLPDAAIADLCTAEELERASLWGLAMRLGQRLSGGLAASLERSILSRDRDILRLTLQRGEEALYGETVERRLKKLATALGCRAEVATAHGRIRGK